MQSVWMYEQNILPSTRSISNNRNGMIEKILYSSFRHIIIKSATNIQYFQRNLLIYSDFYSTDDVQLGVSSSHSAKRCWKIPQLRPILCLINKKYNSSHIAVGVRMECFTINEMNFHQMICQQLWKAVIV